LQFLSGYDIRKSSKVLGMVKALTNLSNLTGLIKTSVGKNGDLDIPDGKKTETTLTASAFDLKIALAQIDAKDFTAPPFPISSVMVKRG